VTARRCQLLPSQLSSGPNACSDIAIYAVTSYFPHRLRDTALHGWAGVALLLLFTSVGCNKNSAATALATSSPTPAASLPWQPHGLRRPTVRCDFAVPAGWTRSASPMPDHLAELLGPSSQAHLILAERVETSLPQARERAVAYYQSGLLTAVDAKLLQDAALPGCQAQAHQLQLRSGPKESGRVELVILLAFPELPVINLVARFPESDLPAQQAVLAVASSLRCQK
jgi:hypothetical protein